MTKWLISQLQLDMNSLEKGKNELKMNFSFSALFPENAATETEGHVRIDFVVKTSNDKKFLTVTFDSFYSFSQEGLPEQNKRALLEEKGFAESYDEFRKFLSDFTERAHLQKMLLPEYAQLK